MPASPPVVTGISPKEGPPGTRVTIRGENLGTGPQDLLGVTICGVECLLSAEWISPSKIIGRFGAGKGRGDVIVTTRSGGQGTCTVQFRGFFEAIGPLKESAVWIDESYLINNMAWGRKRPTSPSQFHQDNPLGLSDEGNVKRFPEETLHELFPDGSGNLTSENFVASWFLLENHNGASFDDLKAGLSCLRRKVNTQKEGELSFLKANVGSVMDQLETLNAFAHALQKDKEEHGSNMTENMEVAIVQSKAEADTLFQEVLGRKDRADSTRNALSVLQRFKFLFNLPCTIERNIQKGDYDIVINDYARAKSLFTDTEVQIFNKVYQEVEQRITDFREMLAARLKDLPLPLEEQKRLVRYLVNLEAPGDPAWDCIKYQHDFIVNTLNTCKDDRVAQDQISPDGCVTPYGKAKSWSQNNSGKDYFRKGLAFNAVDNWQVCPPDKVLFVEELTDIMGNTFPDLWKLGLAYFKGDLSIKDVSGEKIHKMDPSKQIAFKKMVLDAINLYANMYRAAILPHTLSGSQSDKQLLGVWSATSKDIMGGWLPQCIRYVTSCYSSLLNLDLPGDALEIVQKLNFDLRRHCSRVMFKQATEDVKNLYVGETWVAEIDDNHGGIMQLPVLYENIVVETLQLVKEAVLQTGARESVLLSNTVVASEILSLIQELLQAFSCTLETLAFQPESPTRMVENSTDLAAGNLDQEKKFMMVLSNCNYTVQIVLPRLEESLQKHAYPYNSQVSSNVIEAFRKLHERVFEAYMELKCDPIVGTIEQSMYTGRFDWNNCLEPVGARAYIKEILLSMIAIHAEVYAVSPMFVKQVMIRIVEAVAEELARLFSCITKFSTNGSRQARIDLLALQHALTLYKTNVSTLSFKEAMDCLPPIASHDDKKMIEDNLNKFQRHMKFLLLCFHSEEATVKGSQTA